MFTLVRRRENLRREDLRSGSSGLKHHGEAHLWLKEAQQKAKG